MGNISHCCLKNKSTPANSVQPIPGNMVPLAVLVPPNKNNDSVLDNFVSGSNNDPLKNSNTNPSNIVDNNQKLCKSIDSVQSYNIQGAIGIKDPLAKAKIIKKGNNYQHVQSNTEKPQNHSAFEEELGQKKDSLRPIIITCKETVNIQKTYSFEIPAMHFSKTNTTREEKKKESTIISDGKKQNNIFQGDNSTNNTSNYESRDNMNLDQTIHKIKHQLKKKNPEISKTVDSPHKNYKSQFGFYPKQSNQLSPSNTLYVGSGIDTGISKTMEQSKSPIFLNENNIEKPDLEKISSDDRLEQSINGKFDDSTESINSDTLQESIDNQSNSIVDLLPPSTKNRISLFAPSKMDLGNRKSNQSKINKSKVNKKSFMKPPLPKPQNIHIERKKSAFIDLKKELLRQSDLSFDGNNDNCDNISTKVIEIIQKSENFKLRKSSQMNFDSNKLITIISEIRLKRQFLMNVLNEYSDNNPVLSGYIEIYQNWLNQLSQQISIADKIFLGKNSIDSQISYAIIEKQFGDSILDLYHNQFLKNNQITYSELKHKVDQQIVKQSQIRSISKRSIRDISRRFITKDDQEIFDKDKFIEAYGDLKTLREFLVKLILQDCFENQVILGYIENYSEQYQNLKKYLETFLNQKIEYHSDIRVGVKKTYFHNFDQREIDCKGQTIIEFAFAGKFNEVYNDLYKKGKISFKQFKKKIKTFKKEMENSKINLQHYEDKKDNVKLGKVDLKLIIKDLDDLLCSTKEARMYFLEIIRQKRDQLSEEVQKALEYYRERIDNLQKCQENIINQQSISFQNQDEVTRLKNQSFNEIVFSENYNETFHEEKCYKKQEYFDVFYEKIEMFLVDLEYWNDNFGCT